MNWQGNCQSFFLIFNWPLRELQFFVNQKVISSFHRLNHPLCHFYSSVSYQQQRLSQTESCCNFWNLGMLYVTKLKSLWVTFSWLWRGLNFILMRHILPTLANQTIGEEIQDCYPVFSFLRLSQWTHWFHSFTSMIDPLFSFFAIYGWKQDWYCANKRYLSFSLFQNKLSR